MRAGDALLIGQSAQHYARRLWLQCRLRRRQPRTAHRGCFCFTSVGFLCLGGWRGFSLDLARSGDHTAFDLFDNDLLAAAVAEALAYDARLGARLERKRLARDAKFLLAGVLGLAHSVLFPYTPPVGACALAASGELPVRKRVKYKTRVRKSRFQVPKAGLHVPHLDRLMPNPIGRR